MARQQAGGGSRHHHQHHTTGGIGGPAAAAVAAAAAARTMSTTTTTTPTMMESTSMEEEGMVTNNRKVVVASLSKKSPHPYSAVSLSPNRTHAVTACNDTLQILSISPNGMEIIQTVPFAPHFAKSTVGNTVGNNPSRSASTPGSVLHRGLFDVPTPNAASGAGGGGGGSGSANNPQTGGGPTTMMNVVINHVAWSPKYTLDSSSGSSSQQSFIAAAGSNGAIAVWHAEALLQKDKPSVPEVALIRHVRAVNRVSWHPQRPMILSASHDATARLWERKKKNTKHHHHSKSSSDPRSTTTTPFSLFAGFQRGITGSVARDSYTWQCSGVFEPRAEAVRDISWNPLLDDVFALCTSSGTLIIYNCLLRAKPLLKVAAHDRDATTLDWHPLHSHVIATGGSNDRLVKVWNLSSALAQLERSYTPDVQYSHLAQNQNTISSRGAESTHTDGTPGGGGSESSHSIGSRASAAALLTGGLSGSSTGLSRQPPEHVLAVAAAVKRIKWRPPTGTHTSNAAAALDTTEETTNHYYTTPPHTHEHQETTRDRHESMMVVATAPTKGESGGGAGLIALWSYYRPFMPLSVVEGHKEGAVADVDWLDTPGVSSSSVAASQSLMLPNINDHVEIPLHEHIHNSNNKYGSGGAGIWQHVLSVGKDGRCLIQSLARGERPLDHVPPSCFAMANLSPFQSGYGSLQIFSVCQQINHKSPSTDFYLTGLRQDAVTALAPGIFREEPVLMDDALGVPGTTTATTTSPLDLVDSSLPLVPPMAFVRHRIPRHSPMITFNVADQGELDHMGNKPADGGTGGAGGGVFNDVVVVAPEVVHLSRYAAMYVLYPTAELPTRVDLCLHNAQVASTLQNEMVTHMWQMIAVLLETSGVDSLAPPTMTNTNSCDTNNNVIQYSLAPTIRAILEERADDGDVQSCVALCEVLQVVNTDQTTQIGIEIQLVREWYLAYIDLLQDMCLFSHACSVIRNCKDPLVSALNKQSTTISESCPQCGKPILADGSNMSNNTDSSDNMARRICKSCRKRVGKCFLCHEPVKGMYVWCPGCGHGGHLDHALAWFGGGHGGSGATIREVCPTGCGHKCNVMRTVSAFPRTDSMRDAGGYQQQQDIVMGGGGGHNFFTF